MKIKFKSPVEGGIYSGKFSFANGEVKDIPEEDGKRLLSDFPEKFSEVKAETKQKFPSMNKMRKSDKTK